MTRHLIVGFLARMPQTYFRFGRILCSLALAIAMLAACRGDSQQPGAPAAGGSGGGPAMPVEAVTISPTPLDRIGEFVGTLRSRTSTTIQPQAEGFLTRILVKSGDRVSPGAPLFEIDSSTPRVALSGLESLRAAREADAAFARQQAERAKALLAAGAASQQEFEQATTLQKTAEAQLKAVEEQIRQQQTELGYYRVTAPTAGVVGDIPVRQGDRVTRTTLLTTLDDNSGLEVYIRVPVQQASGLKLGLPVRLLDESGALLATERIAYISPAVDDATQTVLVKAPVSVAH
jgi:RND family efflux transporter MFP subunit